MYHKETPLVMETINFRRVISVRKQALEECSFHLRHKNPLVGFTKNSGRIGKVGICIAGML